MKLQILTMCYGEKHIELFRRACLKTLSFPENRRAIYENKTRWNICTDEEHIEYLKREIDIYFPELEINFIKTEDLRRYTDPIQSAIIWQIEDCLRTKSRLLIAPPDTLFAEGSVKSLVFAGREPGSVVVVPHPRVLPEILSSKFDPFVSSPELVRLSMACLHQSWSDAECGHVRQNSYVGGVKWWRVNEKVISGQHYLPTPYLMDFTEADLQYFKTQISFGSFDHIWANDILLPAGRQRYIASSDSCFIAEITERDKNVPPIWDGDKDSFWRSNFQFQIDKQTVFTFRSE